MSRKILQEQPPTENSRLSEWLTRVLNQINGALEQVLDLQISDLPLSIYDGMLRFFGEPIPPDILYGGPWIVVDGVWRPMVSMVYQGEHVAGATYYPQDVVVTGPWTMVANKKTTDNPAPQPSGPKENTLPDIPAWVTNSNASVVYTGQKYVFNQGGWFSSLRVWVPELTADTHYRFVIVDNTDPTNPVVGVIEEPVLNENDWTTIAISNKVVQAGAEFYIYIDALNSGGSTPFGPFGWTYGGVSQGANPALSQWNTNNQNTILRVDKTDLDSTDRTAQLLGIIAGSTITISLTANPNIFRTYNVNLNPVDAGSAVSFNDVTLADSAGTIGVNDITTITADIPIAQATEYVQLTNYWPGNQPSWATIEGIKQFDGVDQPGNTDNAFGVDIAFTPATISPDWDYLSYSLGITDVQTIVDVTIESALNNASVESQSVFEALSLVPQVPAGLDIPLQLNFGPATATPDFSLDGSGTITCQVDGSYDIDLTLNCFRVNNPQTAYLVFWTTINGAPSPTSVVLSLENSNANKPLIITVEETLSVGDELRLFVMRDSSGSNDGIVGPFIPVNPIAPDAAGTLIQINRRNIA